MAKRGEEGDWEKLVFWCIVILAVIAFFKFLFWVSLGVIIVGIIWLIIDHTEATPWVLVAIGIIVAVVSYGIGYGFEQSSIGKPIVDGAKAVVQADNQIQDAKQQAFQQTANALQNSTIH